jgi:hypothetical protein
MISLEVKSFDSFVARMVEGKGRSSQYLKRGGTMGS